MGNTRKVLLSSVKKSSLFQLSDEQSKKLKKVLLEIYEDIFRFCEENQIKIMLGGGSVLGCIRHGGFIPWDDDMDLMMCRNDYNKFVNSFEMTMGDKYELFVPDGKHKVSHLFLKVSRKGTLEEDIYTAGCDVKTGIAIDVFPIENAPKNFLFKKMKTFISNAFAYMAVSVYMYQNKNKYMKNAYWQSMKGKVNYIFRMLLGAFFSFRDYKDWYVAFDKFVQDSKESEVLTIPTGRKHYGGEMQRKEVFYPPKSAKFEGLSAYVPNQAEIYLESLYGDYMKLPSEEQREKHFYTKIEF